ncbi:hypothetical protein [Catenulispora yoronensis]
MIAVIPLLTLLSLLRVRGTGATDTVWAEDGALFFKESLHSGPLRLLITPYNGYLHLVPRVAVDVARLFPLAYLAIVLAVTGALISSSLAVFVYRVSRAHLRSRLLCATVAAPLALTWVAQTEVGNNIADAQWYFVYASFWAALYRGRSVRGQVLSALVIFLAVASDPFAVVFFPLLRRNRPMVAGMAAGLLYQGIGVVFMGALSSRSHQREYDIPLSTGAYIRHVIGHVLWPPAEFWLVGVVLVAGLLAWILRGQTRHPRLRASDPRAYVMKAAFAYSVVFYFALTIEGGFIADRYAYPATALLLAGMAAAAAETERGRGLLAGAVAVSVCWGYFGHVPDGNLRADSPSWRGQLHLAAAQCVTLHEDAADVAIAPHSWKVRVPCRLLLRELPAQ